jgi:hypothetical protein
MSDTTNHQSSAPVLEVPYYFWNAPRVFKSKGWEAKEAGIGIALPKLERYRDKPTVTIAVNKGKQTFDVSPQKLLDTIESKGCYNQNGKYVCGYVTKGDLYSLASASKEGRSGD